MRFEPDSGVEPPVARPGEPVHPLVRPGTVRGLWIGFAVVLAALVLGDLLIHGHPGFGIDGTFGFYAWYGLGTCVAMVIFAKGLGVFLKRRDDYYLVEEERERAEEEERAGAGAAAGAGEAAGGARHD